MNTRDQLEQLYNKRINDFKQIAETFPNEKLAGPFLMSPNEKYETQPKKLLIIGQQTNGWSYHATDVKNQMGTYEKFNLGIEYYSTPFWNIVRKLENAIGIEKHSCAWTNINKYDLNAKKPYGKYEKEIKKLDSILFNEIAIIEPDICVFFTGPSFDKRIKSVFQDLVFEEIENWDKGQLVKLKHSALPELTFKTHHPKSLRIRQIENRFIEYMKNIKQQKQIMMQI